MAKSTITPEHRSAQEKSFPSRNLKVRQGYYDYQLLGSYKRSAPVPWIHIKGYWLDKAGFTIDTPVSVEVQDGCLIIKAIRSGS